MSQHIAVPNSEKFDATKGTLLRSIFSVAAAVGLLGAGVVYFANKELFAHVWLFAFMYFSPCCAAASSGTACITRRIPSGPWSSADRWKISHRC